MYLTELTTRSAGVVSGQSFGSSAVSLACITSMCSVQCFRGGHSLRLAFGSFFYPHPSPLNSSTVKSVWQVPGSIGVGAHGWRARVCQPWGRNSVLGLAVPKVETLGHPGHPSPLSDAVVKCSYNFLSPLNDLLTFVFFVWLSLLTTPEKSLAIFVLCIVEVYRKFSCIWASMLKGELGPRWLLILGTFPYYFQTQSNTGRNF